MIFLVNASPLTTTCFKEFQLFKDIICFILKCQVSQNNIQNTEQNEYYYFIF